MTRDNVKSKEPTEVLSVIKTIKILEVLAEQNKVSLTELSALIGGHKSTVYRFMCTLIDLGYVARDENELYSPTLKMFQLGMCIYSRIDLVSQAMPTLKRLALLSEETVHLVTENYGQLIYLHKIESNHNLRVSMQSKVGGSAPAYCTGVGKIMLAYKSKEEIETYMSTCNFIKFTPSTITNRLDLEQELVKIRHNGWCYDDEEHETGVRCVAAPIRNFRGDVIASISVSGPTVRLTDDRMAALTDIVVSSALEISKSMGFKQN